MKFLQINLTILFAFVTFGVFSQKNKTYQLTSPDGKNVIKIEAGTALQWSVTNNSTQVITPSVISMQLQSGEVLGNNAKVISAKKESVNTSFKAIDYIKDVVPDVYNQLTLNCKGDYGIIFRAYDDGVAYRFFTKKRGQITVVNEVANFNFDRDYKSFVPLVRDLRGTEQYIQSYEALYTERNISAYPKDTLGFLPIMIDLGNQKKAVITEADLEDYPGMFLKANDKAGQKFYGRFCSISFGRNARWLSHVEYNG